jgi:Cu(I)/Ag(I) efflux system membrane fusion protein
MGDDGWEVLAGVQEGEQVVAAGNLLIDAQAQLNAGARPPADPQALSGVEAGKGPLPAAAADRVRALLRRVDALTAALAADDLGAYNREASALAGDLAPLTEAVGHVLGSASSLTALPTHGQLSRASDLATARQAFEPFSRAAATWVRSWRGREPAFRGVRVYQCPMVDRAIPGGPKIGLWIQLEPPLRNPFLGAEMRDCGTEIPETPQ